MTMTSNPWSSVTGVYIGFAFILDYLAYRNTCKKSNFPHAVYDLKKYVEVFGHDGYVIKGIEKSAGQTPFEFEVSESLEELNLEYVEHLFNGVRFTWMPSSQTLCCVPCDVIFFVLLKSLIIFEVAQFVSS